MFGCETTPTIAHHIALQLHLLSPARRPLQVTQDLSSFWQNAYRDVQKDMKGRYPKHPWPDNPLQALPTAKVKKKMT
jgi:ATP-dependent helicase HrpB